jgi:putative ABC transport system permease protein
VTLRLDPMVFIFALGVAVIVGLLTSIAPALRILAWDRRGALQALLTRAARSASGDRDHRFTRRALVMLQVAASLVLLVGAALLAETYVRLTRVDLGVNPERVLTFGLTLPQARYGTPQSILSLEEELVERLQGLPGVEAVGLTNSLPVQATFLASMTVGVEGQERSDLHESADVRTVNPEFFSAAGLRLAYGRLLERRDATAAIAVVNRTLVRRFWPDAPPTGPEPIGRKLKLGTRWCTIVGVVEDVKYSGPARRAEREAYVPLAYWPLQYASVLVRTASDPMAAADAARQIVHSIDPALPLESVRTMEMVVAASLSQERFRFLVIGAFAAIAFALALVGLYGVMAQSVAQRAREMGIRVALGASRGRIARLVLGEGLLVVGIGVAAGIGTALASMRTLASFLFGITPMHTPAYVVVSLALVIVSGVALAGPARRAMRSNPVTLLRAE